MRWIVRDLGIFLYGCIFAGKCLCVGFFGQPARQPEKQSNRASTKPAVLLGPASSIQLWRLTWTTFISWK